MNDNCFDAGFDLLNPEEESKNIDNVYLYDNYNIIIDHKIKCAMKFNNSYVSYYLYPRSSNATKTPLRMANSV